MSQQITLQLPEELYQRMREAAKASDRSVEDLLLESASMIFPNAADLSTLDSLATYSNEQLWNVVLRRLGESQRSRLHNLSDEQKQRALNETEERELDYLLDLVDRLMLLRSKALLLLKQRGQDVDSYLQAGG